MVSKAVVLLSGGLDSATTLAIAKSEGYECYALSVNYHQRHIAELAAAKKIATQFKVKDHKTVEMDLSWMLTSALTNPDLKMPTELTSDIPITYVPARNTLMLTLALGWAEVIGAHDIFIGVNAVDYSGYPDCRPEYIEQFQKMANLATKSAVEGQNIHLHTPLIHLSKEAIILQGMKLGVDYGLTVSCYQADQDGHACGVCDSCRLRQNGFKAAGVDDPTSYQ
ncbi:7-cyano-7-deazaguanine synthase QueC [Candidatus Methylopumilus universalis]|uniref:7-cyano-7-deazaguanine synthase QueC n=1 Tax=Candidatus Methylopumilus universalis TaxID=2588536 RepID=UPI003BEF352A